MKTKCLTLHWDKDSRRGEPQYYYRRAILELHVYVPEPSLSPLRHNILLFQTTIIVIVGAKEKMTVKPLTPECHSTTNVKIRQENT